MVLLINIGGFALAIFVLLIVAIGIILPVAAIIDIIRNDFRSESAKIFWVLLVFFLPFLGSVLYFVFGKRDQVHQL